MRNQVLTVADYLLKVQQPAGPVTKGTSQGFVKNMNFSMPKSLRWEPASLAGRAASSSSNIEINRRPQDEPKTMPSKAPKLGTYIKQDYDIFAPMVKVEEMPEENGEVPH
jgi:hypothetical protein